MFHVKICGVRKPSEVSRLDLLGVDAVGFNFYPRSKRYLSEEAAAELHHAVPQGVAKVGLFVDAPEDRILKAFVDFDLRWIQLHGEEPVEYLRRMPPGKVVKAFRVGPQGLGPIAQYVREAADQGHSLAAILLDSWVPGAQGGTGVTADWARIALEKKMLPEGTPIILAGGLHAENVAQAIHIVRPFGVDTAGGVEGPDGFKNAERTEQFAQAALAALNGLLQ